MANGLTDPRELSGLGKLGFILQSAANPNFATNYRSEMARQAEAQRLGKLREEELAQRKSERAFEIQRIKDAQARQDAQRQALGNILSDPVASQALSQRLSIPSEYLSSFVESGGDLSSLTALGKLTSPSMGATGAIVERLMAENPDLSFSDALAQVQTGYRQGVQFTGGQAVPIQGLGQALGSIAGQERYGQTLGGLQAEQQLAPQIEREKAQEREVGKERGVAKAKLESLGGDFNKLNEVTSELRDLAENATYTKAGQLVDVIRRETGQEPRDSSIARAKYINTVNNEVLPLLRQTFGAAFTEREGESLKATLGDPNMSPMEKQAQLDAFIAAKSRELESLQSRFSESETKVIDFSELPQ